MTTSPTQTEYWNGQAGEVWANSADELDPRLLHFGLAALNALAPRSGEHVLDVGCGAGAMSRELAGRIGPSGRVTAVDLSLPLLTVARARGGPVHYVEADAGRATFEAPFDAVYSRFGVMFFDDPRAAFANLRRAAPEGRLAFVCWRAMDENPAMTRPLDAARHLLPAGPPFDADAPGPFSLADCRKIERVLDDAGWESIAVVPHDSTYELGPTAEAATEMALRIGPLARALREAPEQAEAVRAAILRTFTAEARPDGTIAYPAATWIVTAR